MENNVWNFEKMSWMPMIQVLILCIGTLISFIVAYVKGDVSIYLPFISETGAHAPEMCLFTLTLIFGSVVGCMTIFCRNLVLRHLLRGDDEKILKMITISTIFGLLSMTGLAGVAAFPMSTVLWAHLLAAGIHFVCGMVYIFLETFISHHIPGCNRTWNRLRILLCFLLTVFLVMLVILFPLAQSKWKEVNDHEPAIKQPSDKVFGIMFCSAFFEWAMYGTFLTYLLTLFLELRKFRITVGVVPTPTKWDG